MHASSGGQQGQQPGFGGNYLTAGNQAWNNGYSTSTQGNAIYMKKKPTALKIQDIIFYEVVSFFVFSEESR